MEGQRREDKPVVICLFNWLRCSEERGVIILALSLDRVQAPGHAVWGCRGGLCSALHPGRTPGEGGGLWRWAGRQQNVVRGGFCSPAFKKF